MGQERQVTQNSGLTLYMSEAGRVFSRFDRSTRHSADTQMQVSGQPDNFLQWNWEGGALVADQHFVRGARRVSLRFGGGGASCSLNVLHGKAIGSPNIVYSDFSNHTRYEILSIAVTATSCSIRPGNAFGGSN